MKCEKCGFQTNPGDQICINCGNKLPLTTISTVEQIEEMNTATTAASVVTTTKKKSHKALFFIIGGIVLFLIIAAVIVYFLFIRG